MPALACTQPDTRACSIEAFRDRHAGESVIACGCGSSLSSLLPRPGLVTIGVNDVGRLFDPNYLVVVNPPRQFRGDRFTYVRNSRAQALFTQLELGPVNPPVVRFRFGTYGGIDVGDSDVLHYTQNSPYVAVCLAAYMGAKRIGLIGVDFTDHHFFAKTGRHPLAGRLPQIECEYGALAGALRERAVELVNLSEVSRLQSLPRMPLAQFIDAPSTRRGLSLATPQPAAKVPHPQTQTSTRSDPRRVFVVDYRFLTCGDVFTEGLGHAAAALGLAYDHAYWDDAQLPAKLERFRPDVVLVVHGRRFSQKWRQRLGNYKTAVWLVDEPYEVDDTAQWSANFDAVFVNDPNTLARHRNAHYLPVCFDPQVHRDDGRERIYPVGFIGGCNAMREQILLKLADAGLLSYVVGGPWRAPALRKLCLANNVSAQRTAELYRQTEIVINVFRETHHYNVHAIPAVSMNPRIYEALACGAAVISERRDEIRRVFPQLPQFDTPEELLSLVRTLLADRDRLAQVRRRCVARLVGHAYQDRLSRVLDLCVAAHSAGASSEGKPIRSGVGAPVEAASGAAPLATPPVDRLPQVARATGVELREFHTMPRRNLLYHVWPVRGGTWKWNLDELKQRIDLFNGRRIVGIVCDARSEPADAVQEYLEGHGCEYVVTNNDERGEAATFPLMLERVASDSPDELSFYAHAKGVKYEPQFPPNVRRWVEVQYRVTLDDWLAVKAQMQRYAMTGPFRRHGRFVNHRNLGSWHYSGTFFWMRHAHVFTRNFRDVPQFYGGVEAWPGLHFGADETGCLLLDHLRELPYQERFWRSKGDAAVRHWTASVRRVGVPADLATPRPFDGYTWPRLEQKPEEFAWWIEQLLLQGARTLLIVGATGGGVEWHVARRFREQGRDIAITTLAPRANPELSKVLADAQARFGQALVCVFGDSMASDIRSRLADHYDAAFIDGDHGYRGCSADFRLAESLGPRLIGLHDIVDSDWHASMRCCVSRLWRELAGRYETEAVAGGDWGGIGLVKPARNLALMR